MIRINQSPNFGTGPILVPDGSVSAPSYSFLSEPGLGFYKLQANIISVAIGGSVDVRFVAGGLNSTKFIIGYGFSDTILSRDAANTLGLQNSTNAQTFNHYGSEITAGSRYSRLAITHATTSVTAAVGATATATNLIPAKANVLGVNTVVTTGLGVSTGTTGYAVGDGTDPNRWGDVVGTAAGTDTDQTDATANPTGWFTAANNIVITAAGGNFDGTGVIFIDVAYTFTEAE